MDAPRLVVCVSDLHCGGSTALMPPKVDLIEAGPKRQTAIQTYVWEAWRHFHDEWVPTVTGGEPYTLVLGGDLVEGYHHGTRELVSHSVDDHVAIAIRCLEGETPKAERTYIIRGTETHVKNTESTIGKVIGAEQDPVTKRYAWDHLRLTINGSVVSWAHHMPATKRPWLLSSQMALEGVSERYQWGSKGHEMPVCMVRAHRHVFGKYDDGEFAFTVTPSWQYATRFVQKVIPGALSVFGGTVLDFRNREPGETPLIHSKIYGGLQTSEAQA